MKTLLLLPNILHEASIWSYTPPKFDALIAESLKGGHCFLKRMNLPPCPIYLLNEHSQNIQELTKLPHNVVGLISDAGLPCLADPGADLVRWARDRGVDIETWVGPTSLMMALQLSGLSGQRFCFHGYAPRHKGEIQDWLSHLDHTFTHLFIETPYKTEATLRQLLDLLPRDSILCVATELMGPDQTVNTYSLEQWKYHYIQGSLSKRRAVFVLRINGIRPTRFHTRSTQHISQQDRKLRITARRNGNRNGR